MNKVISILFLAAGVTLIVYGVHASDSPSSSLSRFFTGSPTNKTIWLLIGGFILALAGLFGWFRGPEGN